MKQRVVFCIMKKKREKNVESYIIESLFQLMKKKKYTDISITEITVKAGVSRISFYRNFHSKEEIIQKWVRDITSIFLKNSNISYKNDSLENYFIKLFSHLEKYKEEETLIYNAGLIYLLKFEFENTFLESNKDKYNDYKSYFIIGGIFNIYYYWLINDYQESPKDLSLKLVDLLVK